MNRPSAARPNILLIHSDQHRYDCVGAHGHGLVQTPHLDRLAADGVTFSRAFCPIAVCTPARTSLLTGAWSTQHGCIANRGTEGYKPMRPDLPTFSRLLAQAGYRLDYVGKWQVGTPHGPDAFGFHTYTPDTGYLAWRRAQGLPPMPRRNGWFGDVDPVPAAATSPAWGADQTIGLLRAAATRAEPFFIRWDPPEPHLPNLAPAEFVDLYPPAEIPPWPSFPDSLAGKPYIQRQQRQSWGIDGWDWARWAPVVGRYLAVITLLDRQIGRILAALEELELAGNTLVVYSCDHGDLCGGHGLMDKHNVMYDDIMQVPLILRWPGRIEPGAQCDALVTAALDLAVTFCRAAEIPVPPSFQGTDLLETLENPAAGREQVFAAYHGSQFGLYSQRMVRTTTWKYIWNATAEDELYNLVDDPAELDNLAVGDGYANQLAHLRGRLLAWMEETGDPLLNVWTGRQLRHNAVAR